MRNLGNFALIAMIMISLYSTYAFYVGSKSRKQAGQMVSASWAVIAQFGVITLASVVLLMALLGNDFTFQYVADHSMVDMSPFYKVSAFWAGHEGSLLLWLWMLTGYTAVLAYSNIRKSDRLKSLALYITNYVQMFLAFTIFIATNPFAELTQQVPNGMGLNPLLMHWAMVLHPPTLFMGYAGATIPFAFAIAALLDRNSSNDWVERAHKWTLFGWLFLTIGIFLGALWAYVVLGWGGFWGWDPVENASILPWFTGTALLHTLTIYRRRGGMKFWATSLAMLSFVMCVMATFVTRSGIISDSAHAFQGLRLDLFWLFIILMAVSVLVTIYLSQSRRVEFEAKEFFSDFMSRHFTYYINNVALLIFTFTILGATLIPTILSKMGVTDIKLGADFYNRLAEPLGLLYLILITICPFMGWQKTDTKELGKQMVLPTVVAVAAGVPLYMSFGNQIPGFLTMFFAVFSFVATLELFIITVSKRSKNQEIGFLTSLGRMFKHNRSTAGGYISHIGMAIMFFGIAGSMLYVQEISASVPDKPGHVIQLRNDAFDSKYDLVYKGSKEVKGTTENALTSTFDLKDRSTGKVLKVLAPRIVMHNVQQQQTVNAAIHYELFRDFFLVLNSFDESGNLSITLKVNPLISFVWAGSFILVFGIMIAMWPKGKKAVEMETSKTTISTGKKKKAMAGA